ncbi:hypothetical protein WJX81_004974 [Elliptochloris bilobata]|uniref:Sugar phosphate transporter domain-containing protein n=1 Tax=Elliptochloris bilobata TaxID=381761 RepID=A0AAW1S8C5_9CHLO
MGDRDSRLAKHLVGPRSPSGQLSFDRQGRPVDIAMTGLRPEHWWAFSYVMLNMVSATGIVFANKLVLSVLDFHFVYALTFVHSAFTMVGMWLFAAVGMFEVKRLAARQVFPLAAAFVGYVVLWNLSLQLNPVGFYQLAKILIAPAVIAIEAAFYAKRPTRNELLAVFVLCVGVTMATVTDDQVATNPVGLLVALLAVACTAVYQIWAGAKQKELGAGSMQLMHQFAPHATALLAGLVVSVEPLGLPGSPGGGYGLGTLLGYPYSWIAVGAILTTAILGLIVSLSTFLVIGATSSVTFNVVGHLKTVVILAGGCLLFGEAMPPKKLAGVVLGMCGILWYSYLKMTAMPQRTAATAAADVDTAAGRKAGEKSSMSTATASLWADTRNAARRWVGLLSDEERGTSALTRKVAP